MNNNYYPADDDVVVCQKCGDKLYAKDAFINPRGKTICAHCMRVEKKKTNTIIAIAVIMVCIFIFAVIFWTVLLRPSSSQTKIGTKITYENYMKIENDMTYSQVCSILGKEGSLQATSGYGGYTISVYAWERDSVYGYACITVTFENGKVSGKAQAGL